MTRDHAAEEIIINGYSVNKIKEGIFSIVLIISCGVFRPDLTTCAELDIIRHINSTRFVPINLSKV